MVNLFFFHSGIDSVYKGFPFIFEEKITEGDENGEKSQSEKSDKYSDKGNRESDRWSWLIIVKQVADFMNDSLKNTYDTGICELLTYATYCKEKIIKDNEKERIRIAKMKRI